VKFYNRVRPPGAWRHIADLSEPGEVLYMRDLIFNWILGVVFLFSLMFGIGVIILGNTLRGCGLVAFSMIFLCIIWKRIRF
jgi:hypothetical protein